MRRIKYLTAVLGIVAALVAAAGASASTVTVSPGGAFSASGASSFFRIGTATWTCSSSFVTGTTASTSGTLPLAFSAPGPVSSYVDGTAGNVRLNFSGCTTAGITLRFVCDGTSNLVATGATVAGSTPLRLTNFRCTISLVNGCTVQMASALSASLGGGADMHFTSSGTLVLDAPTRTNQNLAWWNSTCTAWLSNGPVAVSGPSGGAFSYVVSPATTISVV